MIILVYATTYMIMYVHLRHWKTWFRTNVRMDNARFYHFHAGHPAPNNTTWLSARATLSNTKPFWRNSKAMTLEKCVHNNHYFRRYKIHLFHHPWSMYHNLRKLLLRIAGLEWTPNSKMEKYIFFVYGVERIHSHPHRRAARRYYCFTKRSRHNQQQFTTTFNHVHDPSTNNKFELITR